MQNDGFSPIMRYKTTNVNECDGNEKKIKKKLKLRGKRQTDENIPKASVSGSVSIMDMNHSSILMQNDRKLFKVESFSSDSLTLAAVHVSDLLILFLQ